MFEVFIPFPTSFRAMYEKQTIQLERMLSTTPKKPLSTHPIFDIVRKQKQEALIRAMKK